MPLRLQIGVRGDAFAIIEANGRHCHTVVDRHAAAVVESSPPESRINPSCLSAITDPASLIPVQLFAVFPPAFYFFLHHAEMPSVIHVAKCLGTERLNLWTPLSR